MTDPCPICHEEASLANAANRAFLPCGHWFHPACIQEWWARILRAECPLCRHTPATAAPPVRLVWWNVANAAEENDPDRVRLGAVCDAIIEHNPTVISLLVCAGESGRCVGRLAPASVLTFIAQRTGLTVADLRPLVLDSLSLGETSWQGVLYDAQRVCCTGRRDAEWVVAPTGARGVLVVFCEFQQRPADGQQRRFRVASTHLSHEPVEAAPLRTYCAAGAVLSWWRLYYYRREKAGDGRALYRTGRHRRRHGVDARVDANVHLRRGARCAGLDRGRAEPGCSARPHRRSPRARDQRPDRSLANGS